MAANRQVITQEVFYLSVCMYMHLACSVPVGDDILEADKQLSLHVQLIDGGVDGVSAPSVTVGSVSLGNN